MSSLHVGTNFSEVFFKRILYLNILEQGIYAACLHTLLASTCNSVHILFKCFPSFFMCTFITYENIYIDVKTVCFAFVSNKPTVIV